MSWSNGTPTPGDDIFTGTENGDSPAGAEDGNDTLYGAGGDDWLQGDGGNDLLDGGSGSGAAEDGDGNDTLVGGIGDDTIRVGPGQDSMVGGGGTDVLDFSGATSGVAMVLAQNQIFQTGFGNEDTVYAAGFTVAYGSDHDDDLFAGSQGDDSLFGNAGNDGVHGNDGNDTIDGGTGNDLVTGENGVDVLSGNDGDDTLHGGQYLFEDPVFGAADSDAATLDGGTGFDVAILNRGNADQDLTFTAGPDIAFDSIVATNFEAFAVRTGSGNDTLVGGANNDSFDGGTGTDSLIGGDGDDLLVIDRSDATGALTFVAGDNVNFDGTEATGFEQFRIHTGTGDDSLVGGDGDDTLNGGLGTDSLEGGAGNDLLEGGDVVLRNPDGSAAGVERVSDLVTYENAAAPISFSLNDGTELVHVGDTEVDELVNIEQVIGTAHDDTMEMSWGNETVDVLMDGRDGNDIISLVGQTAATLDGGDGNDSIFGGNADDTILGGEGDDLVIGGGGNDSIVASIGADTVEGGTGDDSILTGTGNDLVIWRDGDGNDTIDLGDGQDTLQLDGWNSDDVANDEWDLSVDGTTATFTRDPGAGGGVVTVLNYDATDTIACFAEGTRIMTARGEIPVEALRIGDLALTAGSTAVFKPVRWVGHARIDLTRHRARDRIAPVLITAGALGKGVPHRDLRVSPEHALLIDGALVPAGLLLNGVTILQESWRPNVTYWHVELEAHGVLVAEGALAESYLDDGNRHVFGNMTVVALDPDFSAGRAASRYAERACARVVAEGDALLARIRLRLTAEARRHVA